MMKIQTFFKIKKFLIGGFHEEKLDGDFYGNDKIMDSFANNGG